MSLEPLVPNRLDDEDSALIILDQTLLPNEVKYLALHTNEEICRAIKTLQVRGAPAIGVAAAYAMVLAAREAFGRTNFYSAMAQAKAELAASRPTAVNLFWALDRMERCCSDMGRDVVRLEQEAIAIHREDVAMNESMAVLAQNLFRKMPVFSPTAMPAHWPPAATEPHSV